MDGLSLRLPHKVGYCEGKRLEPGWRPTPGSQMAASTKTVLLAQGSAREGAVRVSVRPLTLEGESERQFITDQ
jgi:hypothetical protein